MGPECAASLDRYRNLWNRLQTVRASVEACKGRIREQLELVSKLDGAARVAKLRYQDVLTRSCGTGDEQTTGRAKAELAAAEGDLAEAQGRLQGLQGELPKLEGQRPNAAELEAARRSAWEAIWQDLRNNVPQETQQLVARTYAALLAYKPDAAYSMAISALFSAPPTRQECASLAEQLAREYSIPL
jgi:hypothetical protein